MKKYEMCSALAESLPNLQIPPRGSCRLKCFGGKSVRTLGHHPAQKNHCRTLNKGPRDANANNLGWDLIFCRHYRIFCFAVQIENHCYRPFHKLERT